LKIWTQIQMCDVLYWYTFCKVCSTVSMFILRSMTRHQNSLHESDIKLVLSLSQNLFLYEFSPHDLSEPCKICRYSLNHIHLFIWPVVLLTISNLFHITFVSLYSNLSINWQGLNP
jgi:hypothetical protein